MWFLSRPSPTVRSDATSLSLCCLNCAHSNRMWSEPSLTPHWGQFLLIFLIYCPLHPGNKLVPSRAQPGNSPVSPEIIRVIDRSAEPHWITGMTKQMLIWLHTMYSHFFFFCILLVFNNWIDFSGCGNTVEIQASAQQCRWIHYWLTCHFFQIV